VVVELAVLEEAQQESVLFVPAAHRQDVVRLELVLVVGAQAWVAANDREANPSFFLNLFSLISSKVNHYINKHY